MKNIATIILSLFSLGLWAQNKVNSSLPIYNENTSFNERIELLVKELTPKEKGHLITLWNKGVPRMGINTFMPGEALHGLAAPRHNPATVFPQSIGLAATWNPELIQQIGNAVSDEARAQFHNGPIIPTRWETPVGQRGPLTFWSPVINMARDPRWGRNQENYGEDPLLASRLVVAYVKGLQGNHPKYLKTAAGAKHFVANNEEHNRFCGNANISEKQLREYYFPAYKAAVQEGNAKIVMTAYNALNGTPCVENEWLVNDILRKEWGFDGFVIGDYGSALMLTKGWGERGFTGHEKYDNYVQSAAAVMNAQTLDFDNTKLFRDELITAIEQGMVPQKELDRAFRNVMGVAMQLGLFDDEALSPWKDLPFETMCSPKHKALAQKAAEQSIVLLQNNPVNGKPLLPLKKSGLKKVAVTGPNANALNFGTYSGVPTNPVSPLDGIRNYLGDDVELVYIPFTKHNDAELVSIPMDFITSLDNQGMGVWKATYFDNQHAKGKPLTSENFNEIDFTWKSLPDNSMGGAKHYSVQYRASIIVPKKGLYTFGVETHGAELMVAVNNSPLIRTHGDKKGIEYITRDILLEEGKTYEITITHMNKPNVLSERLRFGWALPKEVSNFEGGEIEAAHDADVVIAVMGLSVDYERESLDRPFEGLPKEQIAMLGKVLKVNPNTVVVLENGSSIESPWLKQHAPAIVEAWYPGEQGGHAIANVLFGEVNPGGRLPMTFVKSWGDLPAQNDYDIAKGRTYLYFEKEPLWAFGHGLSYTSFDYKKLKVNKSSFAKNETVTVKVYIENTGKYDGDEVVQLYVRDLFERNERPIKRLKAFERQTLASGEEVKVELCFNVNDLAYWDESLNDWVVATGNYELLVGKASDDIKLKHIISIK